MNQVISGKGEIMGGQKSIVQEEIEALRKEYAREELTESDIKANPMDQFSVWFQQVLESDSFEANAMTLATATANAAPSARIVLLKGFDDDGFRFYTNYDSRKGTELDENPNAALCFFWPALERQVRVEGKVEKLSREESKQYFQQRPRLSQLGAWASQQSREVASREELENKFEEIEGRFSGKKVPAPEFWGGYLLAPSAIEFWQGRPGRLHDRMLYSRSTDGWDITRLSP